MRSKRAPESRSLRSSAKTSAWRNSILEASSGLAARFSRATSSAAAELSIAVMRFAPPASAAMGEAAGVAEAVENVAPGGERAHAGAVFPLVEEETGFLSLLYVDAEVEPVFDDRAARGIAIAAREAGCAPRALRACALPHPSARRSRRSRSTPRGDRGSGRASAPHPRRGTVRPVRRRSDRRRAPADRRIRRAPAAAHSCAWPRAAPRAARAPSRGVHGRIARRPPRPDRRSTRAHGSAILGCTPHAPAPFSRYRARPLCRRPRRSPFPPRRKRSTDGVASRDLSRPRLS